MSGASGRARGPRMRLVSALPLLWTGVHGLAPSLQPPGAAATPSSSSSPLDAVVVAASAALADESALDQGKERDGSWCPPARVLDLERSVRGLRGRKLAWWLDAPRPLRAVTSIGLRHEISIVALPGSTSLPPAAYPSGSIILVQPLLGQIECRRLRMEARGPPLELMRRTLKHTDSCMNLGGGASHEWKGTAGVASAFLQVVLLGPNMRFPGAALAATAPVGGSTAAGGSSGVLGWAPPPPEASESDADLVSGATMVCAVDDLLRLERPSAEQLSWEADPTSAEGGTPDDAPALLRRLSGRVGGPPRRAPHARAGSPAHRLPLRLPRYLSVWLTDRLSLSPSLPLQGSTALWRRSCAVPSRRASTPRRSRASSASLPSRCDLH